MFFNNFFLSILYGILRHLILLKLFYTKITKVNTFWAVSSFSIISPTFSISPVVISSSKIDIFQAFLCVFYRFYKVTNFRVFFSFLLHFYDKNASNYDFTLQLTIFLRQKTSQNHSYAF